MVTLPDTLLDAVRDRVLTGLGDADSAASIAERVVSYLRNTAETTVSVDEDGTTFVITGDIPAMWLRDSAAQLTPLLRLVAAGVGSDEDRAQLVSLLSGLLRRHWALISDDPYANAFNRTADGSRWDDDDTERENPLAWERKFELDSLSYGPDLAWRLWRATGDTSWADASFLTAARAILSTVRTEQDHEGRSRYRFHRSGATPQDTLDRMGRGSLTSPTGLVWAGFRPSDDACALGYNIPGNHFLALALERLAELLEQVPVATADAPATDSAPASDADADADAAESDATDSAPSDDGSEQAVRSAAELAAEAREISAQIRSALTEHGIVDAPAGTDSAADGASERIWAYEVDGRGNHVFLDDANVPSLLALPYLGCVDASDPVYQATRRAVLSRSNPYYYAGLYLEGVGSPHTPKDHVWPIAKSIEGLTSDDDDHRLRLLEQLMRTDGGTGMMHEGVHVDEPEIFTRAWFSWSNSMFCELALDLAGVRRDGPATDVPAA